MPSARPTGTVRADTYGLMRGYMVWRTVNWSLKIYIGIYRVGIRYGAGLLAHLTGIDYACEFGSIGRASGTAVHELRY